MSDLIDIPLDAYELRSDARGFNALAALHALMGSFVNSALALDCSRVQWIDAHLAAPLLTIVAHARLKGNRITLKNMQQNVNLILRKNGFLNNKAVDNYNTTIPVSFFKLTDEVEFSLYSRKHLIRKEMPKMSPELTAKIFEGIDELFANCALHSQSPVPVVATGQYFPKGERLSFTLSDGGRGVDGSLKAANIPYQSPQMAIDWAMQANNTSRQGDIPGGLGLKLLRDFIELNNGSLLVVSNEGLWQQNGSAVRRNRLSRPFPGTTVVVEIRTNDRQVYGLRSVPSPDRIW